MSGGQITQGPVGHIQDFRLSSKRDGKPLESFKRDTTESDFYVSTLAVVWRVNWSGQE